MLKPFLPRNGSENLKIALNDSGTVVTKKTTDYSYRESYSIYRKTESLTVRIGSPAIHKTRTSLMM